MRFRRVGAVLVLILFAATLLAACGSADANFNRVDVGMTTKEVSAIMGEPQSKSGAMGAEQWVYQDKYVIQFLADKVVSKVKK